MRIAILGSDNFAEPLTELGCKVLTMGPEADRDVQLSDPDPLWQDIQTKLNQLGFSPDAVLVVDDLGQRKIPTGLWACNAVTVFYGIDAPLNNFWHEDYARLFDVAFLDQPKQVEKLAQKHNNASWLPVGINPDLYIGETSFPQKRGMCFVGVVDPKVRPKRSAILQKASIYEDLKIAGGRKDAWFPTNKAAELYRTYQIVLNENLFEGVTTRPLEVMASGGCLLSEEAKGAMDLFFQDNEHLGFFNPENFEEKIQQFLTDRNLRQKVSKNGKEEVLANHTLMHRAQQILKAIEKSSSKSVSQRARAQGKKAFWFEAKALLMAGLRWPKKNGQTKILRATGRLEAINGLKEDESKYMRWAGLAQASIGQWQRAFAYFNSSEPLDSTDNSLLFAITAYFAGHVDQAKKILHDLSDRYPELLAGIGTAQFHFAAAKLLKDQGKDLTPGFSRTKLAPVFWTALEHALEATRLLPDWHQPWEILGDILLKNKAFSEAYSCYYKASSLLPSDDLLKKTVFAGHKGYMQ